MKASVLCVQILILRPITPLRSFAANVWFAWWWASFKAKREIVQIMCLLFACIPVMFPFQLFTITEVALHVIQREGLVTRRIVFLHHLLSLLKAADTNRTC